MISAEQGLIFLTKKKKTPKIILFLIAFKSAQTVLDKLEVKTCVINQKLIFRFMVVYDVTGF